MDEKEGARIMVMALRLCREYALEHDFQMASRTAKCQCRTCTKVYDLYDRIGGNDKLDVLYEKYFKGGKHD